MRRLTIFLLLSVVATTFAAEVRSSEIRKGDVVHRIVDADRRERMAFRHTGYETRGIPW